MADQKIINAVEYIDKMKDDPEFIAELKKRKLRVFPSNLSFLINQLEKAGYEVKKFQPQVDKEPEPETSTEEDPFRTSESPVNSELPEKKDVLNESLNTPITNEEEELVQEKVINLQDILVEWKNVMAQLKNQKESVYALVYYVKLISLDHHTLILGFDLQKSFQMRQFELPVNKGVLEKILQDTFNTKIEIQSKLLD